ncbi:MAG: long-chain-fatty-acid--CoA ligase [Alphaproteobacteria bacterium]|nr:MAG: long-chain-fatty-acid--CoA ligase [Alphaproteobacteria bacterium]
MRDLMQHWEMRVSHIIDHAAKYHPRRSIVSRDVEGSISHTDWAGIRDGALRTAQALAGLGIRPGDVVGVMAWNTARHLKVWYGVSGAGAVLHTLNPRLFAEQLVYIINHAEDRFVMVDPDLVPVLEAIADKLPKVERYIVLTDAAHMPETSLRNASCFEDLIASVDGDFRWVEGDERDPCGICYTSGTTGNPKGVVYTHRSNVLHALASNSADMVGLKSADVVMPVVPLFHANGWSLGYAAPMAGAAMVMPGRDMTPAAIHEMLEMGVTTTAAVPTIWLGLIAHMRANGLRLSTLKKVIIGGSSCPRAVIEAFQKEFGAHVYHAWGMTETSPLGTICSFTPEVLALDEEARLDIQCTVGHPPFTVDLRITDDEGHELPWDGETQGRLWIRGPGVVQRYLKFETDATDDDNWFDTGDIATMDANAYVRITDRSKDVIKSGGEWISSIELENAAVAHPGVAEAAAIGVPHEKWGERPILVVVPAGDTAPDKRDVLDLVGRSFARWQVPDDVVFVPELPHTATGKISKLELRKQLEKMNYSLPAG